MEQSPLCNAATIYDTSVDLYQWEAEARPRKRGTRVVETLFVGGLRGAVRNNLPRSWLLDQSPLPTSSNHESDASEGISPRAIDGVLFYCINYAPETTGCGRFTTQLSRHLAESGSSIEVITAPPHYPQWSVQPHYSASRYETVVVDGIRITRCPIILRQQMRGLWRVIAPLSFALSSAPIAIWRILLRRPRLVVVVEPTMFVAPIAILLAWIVGARTVLHVQDLEIDAAFAVGHLRGAIVQRFAGWLERKLLRAFDGIVTISEQMRLRLEVKGADAKRIFIVRNWVDLSTIVPLSGENVFRRELQLSDEKFVALYAGSVGAKQGLSVMLDAAKQTADNERIVFVISGDGPEKAKLTKEYANLRNVRFLPIQPEWRLCELLNLADVHILPQVRGAADLMLPSKLGGMLASGRPVLVTADEGTELYDFLSEVATIVPSGDSASVAKEVAKLEFERPEINVEKTRSLLARLDSRTNLAGFASILCDICGARSFSTAQSTNVADGIKTTPSAAE